MKAKSHLFPALTLLKTKSTCFLLLVLIVSSCGGATKVDKTNSREKFKMNGYDLILDAKHNWSRITFKIPSCFLKNYYSQGTVQAKSFTRETSTFNGHFTIEEFEESDQYLSFVEGEVASKDLLNLFHDAYVHAVAVRLTNGVSSLKKELPKGVKYKGVIQVVREYVDDDYDDPDYYVIATMKIKKRYYVVSWLTSKEMMSYTYDDFIDILKTIRARK